jgi:Zn-dependent peptidase ImmA (M78 family)/DNA-binding XRE family transcriptional regulator
MEEFHPFPRAYLVYSAMGLSGMNGAHDALGPSQIGERLRIARESAGVTQAAAATAIGAARTTIVAMEQGQRRVKIDEFQKLARLYGTSVNALLRREAVHVDLVPRFRKMIGSGDDAIAAATQLLADLAQSEIELENLLGIERTRNYPPERPILPGDVIKQAELDAFELRQRLGLGVGPIQDIISLLEFEFGVRVYIRRFDGRISGLFAYDEPIGACILLNANHPRERRTQTAAHETAHLVATRRQPEVLQEALVPRSAEERYADAFGRALLMPARGVTERFREITAGASQLTRRHIIVLAHTFGTSREAAVRRLEELKLAKLGTWDWFQANGGITDEQARQVLGDLILGDMQKAEANKPTTLRLNLLAGEVARRGLLSEGQLARLLHLSRVELRELLDGLDMEGSAENEAPDLPT